MAKLIFRLQNLRMGQELGSECYSLVECQLPNVDENPSGYGLGLKVNRLKINQIIRIPIGLSVDHIFRGKRKIERFISLYKMLHESSKPNH